LKDHPTGSASRLVPQGPEGTSYARPTLIKTHEAVRFLWGDDAAGFVSDWIYGSSTNIHMMSFEMPIGTRFGNSPDFKTFYNCAETYHCLKGEFTFHCPETGEVHVLRQGDTLYFLPDTSHWGYNFGSETSRILETITPRTTKAIESYAKAQPRLERIAYTALSEIPEHLPGTPIPGQRARLARNGDYLYEIVGEKKPLRVAIVASTKLLTTGFLDLHAGQESELITHPGDKVLYGLSGVSNVFLPDITPNWWELTMGDAAFIPGGVRHAFFNTSDNPARLLFSVAPDYRS